MRNRSYENVLSLHVYFYSHQTHFRRNGFVRRLVLRQKLSTTQKWPILLPSSVEIHFLMAGYYADYTGVFDDKFISVPRRQKKKKKNQ